MWAPRPAILSPRAARRASGLLTAALIGAATVFSGAAVFGVGAATVAVAQDLPRFEEDPYGANRPWRRNAARAPFAPGEGLVSIALIDPDRALMPRIAELGRPVTVVLSPFEPDTLERAGAARAAGHEVALILPQQSAAAGAEYDGQVEVIGRRIDRILARYSQAVGVAAVGGDDLGRAGAVRALLAALGERGRVLIDARSSNVSMTALAARRLGVPAAAAQFTLDADADPKAISGRLDAAAAFAAETGAAVAVGAATPEMLDALEEWIAGQEAASGARIGPATAAMLRDR